MSSLPPRLSCAAAHLTPCAGCCASAAWPLAPLQGAPSLLGRLVRSGTSLRRRSAATPPSMDPAFSARGPVDYELGGVGGVELPLPGEEEEAAGGRP